MALTSVLTKYGAKLKEYLSIWKKTGKQYSDSHPDPSIRGAEMQAGLTDLVAHELAAPVVTVGTITDTTVALSWTVSTTTANAKTYTVSKSIYPNKGFTAFYSNQITASTTASGLNANTTYYFKVVASGSDGNPGQFPYVDSQTIVTAKTILTKLATVATFTTVPDATSVLLTWSAVTNATSYKVERSTAADFTANLTTVYEGALLTKTDDGLTPETDYYYRVTASAEGYTTSDAKTSDKTTTIAE
jgi:hypothetical protein